MKTPKLVQQMVDAQDAGVRDRAMEAMRAYLRDDLDEQAMLKLWRALFFAMWLADMAPVQRELATRVGGLIHAFEERAAAWKWLAAFCSTMHGEWDKLDKHRIDKYYSLLRSVLGEALAFSKLRGLGELAATLDEGLLLRPGPRLHVCDVLVEEVMRQSPAVDDAPELLALLRPFLALLKGGDKAVATRVSQRIVGEIAKSDEPVALELARLAQPVVYELAADPATPHKNRPDAYAVLQDLVAKTGLPLDAPIAKVQQQQQPEGTKRRSTARDRIRAKKRMLTRKN